MKVALCFSGHMRTYRSTHNAWNKFVIEPFDADVFIHTWKRLGIWVKKPEDPKSLNCPGTVSLADTFVDAEIVEQLFSPKKLLIEDYCDMESTFIEMATPVFKWREELGGGFRNYKIPGLISQYYGMYQTNQLRKQFETETGQTYDVILRSRPDLQITKELSREVLDSVGDSMCIQTKLSSVGPYYLNDVFTFSNGPNMDIFTNVYAEYLALFEDAKEQDAPGLFFESHNILWNQLTRHEVEIQQVSDLPFISSNKSLKR